MDKNDEKRQQLLVRMMASGGDRSYARRDYLLEPWRRIACRLSPLIGDSGFVALLGRAAKLVTPQFGWMAGISSSRPATAVLDDLGDSFDQNPDAAQAGNAALLDTFTSLLADLIGEALTIRLLQTAVDGAAEPKNAQEQN